MRAHSECSGFARPPVASALIGPNENLGRGGRTLEPRKWGGKRATIWIWLPTNATFKLFLSIFLNVSGGPPWIRTPGRCVEHPQSIEGFYCQQVSACLSGIAAQFTSYAGTETPLPAAASVPLPEACSSRSPQRRHSSRLYERSRVTAFTCMLIPRSQAGGASYPE